MPTESCKKQLNRRQQKQTRKERERNNLAGNATRSPSNESQELLNQIQEVTIGKEDLLAPKLRSSTRSRKNVIQYQQQPASKFDQSA